MIQRSAGKILYRGHDEFGAITVSESGLKRCLWFGDGVLQSAMFTDRPAAIAMEYGLAMMMALVFNRAPRRVLLVGLGGGMLVRFLLAACPGVAFEAVEISGTVIRLAREYFQVPARHPGLRIVEAAGHEYLARAAREGERYDFVLVDAFDDAGPAITLQGQEFLVTCREALTGNGIAAFNLWNRPQDRFSERFAAIRGAFAGAALRLTLGEAYRNAIVFGFAGLSACRDLNRLRPAAKALGAELGINCSKYLRELVWQNHG